MDNCSRFTNPISGTSQTITVTTTAQSLVDLGVTADAEMRYVSIDVDGDPQAPVIVGRYWEDTTVPTVTNGKPIQSGEQIGLTLSQFNGFRVRAISSTFTIHITQYAAESL